VFFLFLFVFTVSYEIWKFFKRYEARMRDEQAKIKGLRPPEEPRA
jgi:hypothetical protein